MSGSLEIQNNIQSVHRILLLGDFIWPWYQEACAIALEKQGCEVERFGWLDDFKYWKPGYTEPFYHSLFHRIQFRLLSGPVVWKVNRRLVAVCEHFKPDIVWFYNVQIISPNTVKKLQQLLPDTIFCQYANDNPFSESAIRGLWRNFLASIPYFDIHFSYRQTNIVEYRKYGAKNVHLLRSYFIPDSDYQELAENIPDKFKCDVVFAGHYEEDGRIELLEAILNAGYGLRLYGGGWDRALPKLSATSPLRAMYPVSPATGDNYRYAVCGAKVALCFLSTLNHDTYTRRNFQIPAMKTAMLSQYTDDLAALFKSDEEAMFFRDKNELLNKLKLLIDNQELRGSVAKAAYSRVYADGHDVDSRMKYWITEVNKHNQFTKGKMNGQIK